MRGKTWAATAAGAARSADAAHDKIADEGLKLLNFNVDAQCTPSRSAILTGRHPIRSGTQNLALMGPDGLTRWEVTTAQA